MNSPINYSFIIPHHNSPELLTRCLNSIPQRGDIEIIVVDDNSDEDKKPLIDRFDVNLLKIGKEQSKGAGRARNYGLDVANGKWLLFADCDDFYENNFIDELDKFLDSTYDIVFFDMFYAIDLKTGVCWPNPYSNYIKEFLKNPHSDYWAKSMKYAKTEPWHQMYSRHFISSIGVKFHELPSCNDAWFTQFSASKTTNIYAIDEKLYYWVRNSNSLTNKPHDYEFFVKKEKELLLIKRLKAKDEAWNAMNPIWQGLGRLAKTNGLYMALRILFLRLSNGIIEWEILWHKYVR